MKLYFNFVLVNILINYLKYKLMRIDTYLLMLSDVGEVNISKGITNARQRDDDDELQK